MLRKLILIFLFQFWPQILCEPTYSIVAPKIVRGVFDYNVLVALDGIKEALISCTLEKDTDGNKEKNQQTVIFDEQKKFQLIKPQIGKKWTPGKYTLTLVASGDIKFPNDKISLPVRYEYKQYVILIQTNKAIYRPGEDVLMRVIVVDDQLLPVEKEKLTDLTIYIMDPQGVKLRDLLIVNDDNQKDINRFNFTDGVSDDIIFNLNDKSLEGDWTIQVTTEQQVQNYTFFVASYMLPMVNITIGIPEYLSFNNKVLPYRVDVLYTFGKPMHGEVEIRIKKFSECRKNVDEDYEWRQEFSINKDGQVSGNLDIDGTEFTFNNCTEFAFNISVVAKDNSSGILYKEFSTFEISRQDYKVEFLDSRNLIRPGGDLEKNIVIQSKIGREITESDLKKFKCKALLKTVNDVVFKETYAYVNHLKEIGGIQCVFQTYFDYKEMVISVVDVTNEFIFATQHINFIQNCTKEYIHLKLQTPDQELMVEKEYVLTAESNVEFEEIIMIIIVRGSIIYNERFSFVKSTIQKLRLLIKKEYIPEFLIAVYIKTNSNIILSDSMRLKSKGLFYNNVKFDIKTPNLDAGEEAKMIVEAEEDSTVFLLGLDESLITLKQGNDITKERILAELLNNPSYNKQTDTFMKTGMSFITNGKPECPDNGDQNYFSLFDSSIVDPCEIDPNENECNIKPPETKIRKNFRETWIWDQFRLTKGKRIGLKSHVPDSITTWKVTGFSINKKSGIGLTRNPGYVKVFRSFFVKLNLPYSIQRKEKSEINIMIFNYLNNTLKVNLKVYANSSNKHDILIDGCDHSFEANPQDIKSLNCFIESENVGIHEIIAEIEGLDENHKMYTDGELRSINVIYEGFPQEYSQSILFDLSQIKNEENILEYIKEINFPEERVNGSENLLISGTIELIKVNWRDKLTEIEKGLSNIRYNFDEPLDCCQQRVIDYFPKVFWLKYMKITKRSKFDDTIKAHKAIQLAIDNLCWRIPSDGSSVYFPHFIWDETHNHATISNLVPSNLPPFLWQTAYYLQIMKSAEEFVQVDLKQIQKTTNWLKSNHLNGEYKETNPENSIYNTTTNAYLTAFVRISLNRTGGNYNETEQWLEKQYPKLSDKLEIFTVCYAFQVFNGKFKEKCYKEIMEIITTDSRGKYWKDINDIEDLHLTAYGLMIAIERDDKNNSFDIFKFLMSCQDNQGYFHTLKKLPGIYELSERTNSYLTIICTDAMIKFIEYSNQFFEIENIFLDFEIDNKNIGKMHLNPSKDVTDVIEPNTNITKLKIIAKGYGQAKVNLYYSYNVEKITNHNGDFNITIDARQHNDKLIYLDICANNKNLKVNKQKRNSNIEIDLPSGLTYHSDHVNITSKLIDNIEVKNSGNKIIVYLNKIDRDGICVTIPALESFKVYNRRPVPIKVYDHYDRSGLTMLSYKLANSY